MSVNLLHVVEEELVHKELLELLVRKELRDRKV
jgi:hypothetical protein